MCFSFFLCLSRGFCFRFFRGGSKGLSFWMYVCEMRVKRLSMGSVSRVWLGKKIGRGLGCVL